MAQGLYTWSKTAATNANADATINWAEGQSPSSVNDSARAMMARTAEYRDDIAGALVTAGSGTAYTLTTNEGFGTLALMNGQQVAFTPHVTNGATVTLNVDGTGGKPLRYGPSLELQTGMLIQGTPYVATYNNSDAAFYLQGGFANPYGVPLGGGMVYIGSTAPNSAFAIPIGQAISRTTFATLFALTGTTYGVGDGSTTFNIPDLRGRVPFQPDSGGSGRITIAGGNTDGTVLGGTGGLQNHTLTTPEIPSHTHVNSLTDPGHTHTSPAGVAANVGTIINALVTTVTTSVTTNSATTGITINNAAAGGGGAHTIMPPYILLPYILRVI